MLAEVPITRYGVEVVDGIHRNTYLTQNESLGIWDLTSTTVSEHDNFTTRLYLKALPALAR